MREKIKTFLIQVKIRYSWKRIFLVLGIILGILVSAFGLLSIAYALNKEKVMPNLYLAGIEIGGMTRAEFNDFFKKMNDKLMGEQIIFKYEDKEGKPADFKINSTVVSNLDAVDLIDFDIEAQTERIFNQGKEGDLFNRIFNYGSSLFVKKEMVVGDFIISDKMLDILRANLKNDENILKNASVSIATLNPLDYQITLETDGYAYDYDFALKSLRDKLADWQTLEVAIPKKFHFAEIKVADVEQIESKLAKVVSSGDLQLIYTDPQTRREYNWNLNMEKIKDWIEAQKNNGELGFGLNKEKFKEYFTASISPQINISAENAKFKMEDGKVVEFVGSRPGIIGDFEKTYQDLNQAFWNKNWHAEGLIKSITVSMAQVEPDVKTADVNDLGITEVLGVGISDYSNSPSNRIKNIKNAAAKLNGLLIKPEEEFSTLQYTQPFTIEGGYFPEVVIKGDELKPEVGGGLCQIGTTLFRMAMNSGMPITQRRNHSLVVFHYNDPVNNLPGTDATVYDPAPDFKFKNDTGRYLLLQTFVDTKKEELIFTLWGTSDGRKGYYSRPIVSAWFPAGEPKTIETTKLEPGKKECQNAFRGANASFTYTRELPDGTKDEKIFASHYRALPQICLLGVATTTASSTLETDLQLPIVE